MYRLLLPALLHRMLKLFRRFVKIVLFLLKMYYFTWLLFFILQFVFVYLSIFDHWVGFFLVSTFICLWLNLGDIAFYLIYECLLILCLINTPITLYIIDTHMTLYIIYIFNISYLITIFWFLNLFITVIIYFLRVMFDVFWLMCLLLILLL